MDLIYGIGRVHLFNGLWLRKEKEIQADRRLHHFAKVTSESLTGSTPVVSVMIKRCKPKYKQLEEQFGGTWKYYASVGSWYCDDGLRSVSRVAGCSCDDYCDHPPRYYLYGDGVPKNVYFHGVKFL